MGVCSRCHEKYMTVIAERDAAQRALTIAERERDEALAKYQFMVDRAADSAKPTTPVNNLSRADRVNVWKWTANSPKARP